MGLIPTRLTRNRPTFNKLILIFIYIYYQIFVNVPDNYFTKRTWKCLLFKEDAKIIERNAQNFELLCTFL